MKRYWLLFVLLTLIVTACQQEPKATPTPDLKYWASATNTATITQTATETSTPSPSAIATSTEKPTKTPRPTGTITPTPTPTALIIEVGGNPVRQGTRLPEVETITLDNINRLEEIGRWGYGAYQEVILSEDESEILALTSSGIVVFNAKTMRETRLVNMDLRNCDSSLQFSPSGNYVMCFVVEPPKTDYLDPRIIGVKLISSADGNFYKAIELDKVRHVWMAPDDQRLFISSKTIQVWDIVNEEWLENVEYSLFNDMHFLQDGKSFIAFDTWDDVYYLYSEDGERKKLPSSGTYVSYNSSLLPISHDGKYLAGNWDDMGELFVRDVESGEILFTYCYDPEKCSDDSSNTSSAKLARETNLSGSYPETYLNLLAISPDSKYLVASVQIGYDDILLYFSLPSGELIRKEAGWARNVAFFTKNSNFLTWTSSNIRLKNIYDGTISKYVPELYSSSTTAEISPDSQVLVTGDGNRIEIYNLLDGTMANFLEIDALISDVAHFHHTPKVLAGKWRNEDEAVVWDYFTGEIKTYKTDSGYFVVDYLEVQVTADDQFIRFFIHDTSNYTFNVETGAFVSEMFIGALVNPVKPEIAYFGRDGIGIYSIDPETLEYQQIDSIESSGCFRWFEGFYRSYLPSGEGFACTTEGEVIVFGDFGEERLVFEDPLPDSYHYLKPVYTITNDNTMLLLSHEGNIAAVYDVFSNEKIYQLVFPGTSLVQFTPDNKYLVTLGPGGIFRIYGIPLTDD